MKLNHVLFAVLSVSVAGASVASGSLLNPISKPVTKKFMSHGKLLTVKREMYRLPPNVSSIDGVINQMFPSDFSVDPKLSYVANAHFKTGLEFPATLDAASGANLWGIEQSEVEKGAAITAQYRYTDSSANECKVKLVHDDGILSATVTKVQSSNSTLECNTSLITNGSKAKYALAMMGEILGNMSVSYSEEPPVNTDQGSPSVAVTATITNNGPAVTLAAANSVVMTVSRGVGVSTSNVTVADVDCNGNELFTGESCTATLTFAPDPADDGDVTWNFAVKDNAGTANTLFTSPAKNWHINS